MRPAELVVRIPVTSSRSAGGGKKSLPKIKAKSGGGGGGKTRHGLIKKCSIVTTATDQFHNSVQDNIDKKLDFDDFDKLNVNFVQENF